QDGGTALKPAPPANFNSSPAPIEPPTSSPTATVQQTEKLGTNERRTIEFTREDLGEALRALARKAKINLIIGDEVTGIVTVRLEKKTPLEAIRIIAQGRDLDFQQKSGDYYLKPRFPAPVKIPPAQESSASEPAKQSNSGIKGDSPAKPPIWT